MKNHVKSNILLTFISCLLLGVVVCGVLAIVGVIPKDKVWIPFVLFIVGAVVAIVAMLKLIDELDEDEQDDD